MLIRAATLDDASAMLQIYAHIVRETAISFELEPPPLSEFEDRIRKYSKNWTWLVAESEGSVIGYAYGSSHRERLAYKWSTETSAYVHLEAQGQGVGKRLYQALLPALANLGYCNAYAGIALPNPGSVALHTSVGFNEVGRFPRAGRKFAQWHDIGWFHCALREAPPSEA